MLTNDSEPTMPDWIRSFRARGFRSAFGLCPDEPRLFPGESLYGDWRGHTLILMDGVLDGRTLVARVRGGDVRPYRHDEQTAAVVALRERIDLLVRSPNPSSCGFLLASPTACLLPVAVRSGVRPERSAAIRFGTRVLDHVRSRMPLLSRVVCVGEDAWRVASSVWDLDPCWAHARDRGVTVWTRGMEFVPVDAGHLSIGERVDLFGQARSHKRSRAA